MSLKTSLNTEESFSTGNLIVRLLTSIYFFVFSVIGFVASADSVANFGNRISAISNIVFSNGLLFLAALTAGISAWLYRKNPVVSYRWFFSFLVIASAYVVLDAFTHLFQSFTLYLHCVAVVIAYYAAYRQYSVLKPAPTNRVLNPAISLVFALALAIAYGILAVLVAAVVSCPPSNPCLM